MDNSQAQQSWSSAQVELLRKFLQTASQIPSSSSIQEVLQPATQCRPSFSGYSHLSAGKSFGNNPNPQNETSVPGLNPMACKVDVNPIVASSLPSSLVCPIPDGVTALKYPAPNVNLMVFDPETGFLFDQFTGLYYDANASLFVNKQLNVLLRWNPTACTYSLVGKASDVAAPAQDFARLIRPSQAGGLSASTTTPTPNPHDHQQDTSSNPLVISSSVRDVPFKRERSLSFEEMSPERDDEVFHQRSSPSNKQSSDLSKYDVADIGRRRRSLSFEEMTPERDSDEWPCPSVFPRDRSPSYDERRETPRRDNDSYRGRSQDRGRDVGSYRRDYSRSPDRRPIRRRSSPEISRYSPTDRSRRRSSSRRRSPRRRSRLRTTPERGSRRSSSPDTARWRRRSPGITRESLDRRDIRRYSRSPSSAHQYERRQKDYSERGHSSRRSRSRSRSTENRTNPRRSPSRSRTNEDSDSVSCSSQNLSLPVVSKEKDLSNSEAKLVLGRGFSDSFMAEKINNIHKKNIRKPGNTYGRIFPMHSVMTLFIMLSPLPQQGDRNWDDLKEMLKADLEKESITFHSVEIFSGDGGAPCNYCLVRFKHIEEAFRWYITHEGSFELSNPDGSTCTVFLNFIHNNWKCSNCKEINFALRHFCYKCFWFITQSRKPPILKSQLITNYVAISGLDCRFLSVEEVLVGLPPLDGFNVETLELLTEHTGIPLGLVVFKFKEKQDSGAFFRFLKENSLNPFFINIFDRTGLAVNPILGALLKGFASSASTNPVVPAPIDPVPTIQSVVFPNPPQVRPDENPLLWWQFVEGYIPDGDIMKYLFEEHELVNIKYDSAHSLIILGPLPLPEVFDFMEYRDLLCRFFQSTGVSAKNTEKTAICKAHQFGAPYDFCTLRFDSKANAKEWLEKNNGSLVMHLEDGSTWTLYMHYTKPNWPCHFCKRFNFPLRIQCFSCYKARMSDNTSVTIMKGPTNFIGITGFQNWCSTEDLLFKRLPFLREIKNLTVSYRREPTGVPLGICVLKSPTPAASKTLFNKLQDALVHEIAKASIKEPNRPLLTYIM